MGVFIVKITRVIYNKGKERLNNSLATCSVVLDDCLMLSDLCLYKGNEGYYLVMPSKQDVYKLIGSVNKGVNISYPENIKENKHYEEFYHPVASDFYHILLDTISKGYESCCLVDCQKNCYRPE